MARFIRNFLQAGRYCSSVERFELHLFNSILPAGLSSSFLSSQSKWRSSAIGHDLHSPLEKNDYNSDHRLKSAPFMIAIAVLAATQSTDNEGNKRNKENGLLIEASKKGDAELVQSLLEKKAVAVNFVDSNGMTPLIYASAEGHLSIVKALIANGADVNFNRGVTALTVAAERGHEKVVEVLLENRAEINAAERKFQNTALHFAVYHGHVSIVQMLISKGADVNARNQRGSTPLLTAALKNQVQIVKMLLAKNVAIDLEDYGHGVTPLMAACFMGHIDIVKILITNRANVNATNKYGATPLIIAASSDSRNEEIVKLLLDHKADATCKDKDGKTASELALQFGYNNIYKILESQ